MPEKESSRGGSRSPKKSGSSSPKSTNSGADSGKAEKSSSSSSPESPTPPSSPRLTRSSSKRSDDKPKGDDSPTLSKPPPELLKSVSSETQFSTTPWGKLAIIENPYSPQVESFMHGAPEIGAPVQYSMSSPSLDMTAFLFILWNMSRKFCTPTKNESNKNTAQYVTNEIFFSNQEPFLIQYATEEQKWYIDWSLVTVNGLWCNGDWNYEITKGYEKSKKSLPIPGNPKKSARRIDTLTTFKLKVHSPSTKGFVRYKILDEAKNSYNQVSGSFWYQFTDLRGEVSLTVKEIDPNFKDRENNYRWRAPDFDISFTFEDFKIKHLWYPFVGKQWTKTDTTEIPALPAEIVRQLLDDVIKEKLLTKEGRRELQRRYKRWLLNKMVAHLQEWQSMYDVFLTFVMSVGNGLEESLYAFPPHSKELIQLGIRAAFAHAAKVMKMKALDGVKNTYWKFWTTSPFGNVVDSEDGNEVDPNVEVANEDGNEAVPNV